MGQKKVDNIEEFTTMRDYARSGKRGIMTFKDRSNSTIRPFVVLVLALSLGLGMGWTPVARLSAQTDAPTTGATDATMAPGGFYSDDSPIVRVVERVKDAVVNI